MEPHCFLKWVASCTSIDLHTWNASDAIFYHSKDFNFLSRFHSWFWLRCSIVWPVVCLFSSPNQLMLTNMFRSGGDGFTGPKTCASGTCTFSNQYYSQVSN